MIGVLNLLGQARGGLGVFAFLVLLLACGVVGFLVLRRVQRPARAAWFITSLATVTALAFTVWPNTGTSTVGCVVEFSWTAPFEVQNLANIALFIPVTFFATIASTRPAAAAAAGAGLSAAIELVQALLPFLNRACDTQDLQMNTTGAVIGAAIGWWITRIATGAVRKEPGSRHRQMVTWIWTGTAAAAIAVWFTSCALNPVPADPCDERPAGAITALPGGVTVHAGRQTGHLCITDPDGGTGGLGEDPRPGTYETFDSGQHPWAVGFAAAGTSTAHDDLGNTALTQAVAGSDVRVWSTYRSRR